MIITHLSLELQELVQVIDMIIIYYQPYRIRPYRHQAAMVRIILEDIYSSKKKATEYIEEITHFTTAPTEDFSK